MCVPSSRGMVFAVHEVRSAVQSRTGCELPLVAARLAFRSLFKGGARSHRAGEHKSTAERGKFQTGFVENFDTLASSFWHADAMSEVLSCNQGVVQGSRSRFNSCFPAFSGRQGTLRVLAGGKSERQLE